MESRSTFIYAAPDKKVRCPVFAKLVDWNEQVIALQSKRIIRVSGFEMYETRMSEPQCGHFEPHCQIVD